jgi:hypothetical protein
MGTKENLIGRFINKPNDFTYNELTRFLWFFGYTEVQRSGSRVVFTNNLTARKIKLYKPHPGNILKQYQQELIEKEFRDLGLL